VIGDLVGPLIPDDRKPVLSVDIGDGCSDTHGYSVSMGRAKFLAGDRASQSLYGIYPGMSRGT
jgi:hypothetical protein